MFVHATSLRRMSNTNRDKSQHPNDASRKFARQPKKPIVMSTASTLQVLYEDNHIIAVNKRVGDIVQGDKTGDIPLSEVVKQYIAEKHNKPGAVFLGVVHRLDRPTSGIVIFARTSKALSRLNKLFAERNTKKTYWAIVKDEPVIASDTLIHFLKRNPKQNKSADSSVA